MGDHPKQLNEMIVHHYNWTESTQLEAKLLFERGKLQHGVSIIADKQISGYGKNGRVWQDDGGNVAMTICLDSVGMENWQQLCFVAAVSVGNVLQTVLPDTPVSYKWINDVILGDGKVAGVLLESLNNRFILVGIGVNIASAPVIKGVQTSKVDDYGIITVDSFIKLLQNEFMEQYTQWAHYGFSPIRNQWMARPYRFRELLTVHNPHNKQNYKGIFIGIDRDGNLELSNEHGDLIHINMGEVL